MDTESVEMDLTQWWEISDPVSGIDELLNILVWNVHHFQQVVLEIGFWDVLWKFGRVTVSFKLMGEFDGCSANWHACTMESEREQYIISVKSFIPGVEVAFGHGEGVPQMEETVHVGVGESLEELGLFVGFD